MSSEPVVVGADEGVAAARSSAFSRLAVLTLHLVRRQGRAMVVWGVSLGVLGALYVAMYPSMSAQVNEYMSQLPEQYTQFLGITGGVNSVETWLAMEMFNITAPLALAFLPILLGARAIAGAEERRGIDILLGNPVPRWQVVASAYLGMALELLVVATLLAVITWLPSLALDAPLGVAHVAAGALNLWPFCLFFGGLALVVSALVRRGALAIGLPAAILVAMYVINGLGGISEAFDRLRPFTIFYHYGSAIENGIAWLSFLAILGAATGLTALAAILFQRRDIYT